MWHHLRCLVLKISTLRLCLTTFSIFHTKIKAFLLEKSTNITERKKKTVWILLNFHVLYIYQFTSFVLLLSMLFPQHRSSSWNVNWILLFHFPIYDIISIISWRTIIPFMTWKNWGGVENGGTLKHYSNVPKISTLWISYHKINEQFPSFSNMIINLMVLLHAHIYLCPLA